MRWLDAFILATYALQVIMICFFPVPSAGSTVEMLFKVRKDKNLSIDHPAKLVIRSMPKTMVMISATLFVTATSLLPLVSIIFPQLINYLFPLMKSQPNTLLILTALLLTIGNALTIIGVRMEEIYLQRTFGEVYDRYQNRVGKYLPRY